MKQIPASLSSLLAISVLSAAGTAVSAEREVELEPITVLEDRLLSQDYIPTKDIKEISIRGRPAAFIEEALDYAGEVDISTRSPLGIQSDLGIRGATPEQTLISVNGVVLNDPQTAHHNLDLGLPGACIDRMEVAGASAPSLWGQGAIGGSVNIVTRRPDKNESEASLLYGTDRTQKAALSITGRRGPLGLGISADESSSDGWRYDTDSKSLSVASQGLLEFGDRVSTDLLLAYGEKEFGAAKFYGPYNSKEWTDNLLAIWGAQIRQDMFMVAPKAYFRRHHDKYILDIIKPNYYVNYHTTETKGLILEGRADSDRLGIISATAEFNREGIDSTRLSKHSRQRHSLSLVWQYYRGQEARRLPFGFDASLRLNDYSEYKTEILPQAGVFLMMGQNIRLRSSASVSARPPTYTELYYDSPANKGNSGLSTEKADNYEMGIDITGGSREDLRISATLFRRNSHDLIDWVKNTAADSYYQARNITEVKTEGLEIDMDISTLQWLRLKAGYAYMDSDIRKDYNYISKYALNHPDHKVMAEADIILPFGTQSLRLLYKDRKHYSNYLVMGGDLNYGLNRYAQIFVSVDNIFNSHCEDIRDNPLPGRQVLFGLKIEWGRVRKGERPHE